MTSDDDRWSLYISWFVPNLTVGTQKRVVFIEAGSIIFKKTEIKTLHGDLNKSCQ